MAVIFYPMVLKSFFFRSLKIIAYYIWMDGSNCCTFNLQISDPRMISFVQILISDVICESSVLNLLGYQSEEQVSLHYLRRQADPICQEQRNRPGEKPHAFGTKDDETNK
jgi:hypothetical protein